VAMASTQSGDGYWMVASDGGIFAYGDAHFYGSLGGVPIANWVASMAVTPSGNGYWMANADGAVYHFGDAVAYGNNLSAPRTEPISTIVATKDGAGYWLLEPDAFPTAFSHPGGGGEIVATAAAQVQGDPRSGSFCNPYGPCEAWCALFATWVWRQAGVPIPQYAFVGDVFTWAAQHTAVLPPTAKPAPGDAVLYGTGPQNVDTAVHMGIVAQVWPNGAIDTVEGDAGPGPFGGYNVIMNGPYLPSNSSVYNGFPIFAFAVP
jgi:CHAP domain